MDASANASGRFAPNAFYPAQHDLTKWGPNYAPRFAAVYDVFGDGRTALKTNFSKYHRQYDADPLLVYADAGLRSETRNWRDCTLNAAGNACSGAALATDRDGIVQDHEIGPSPSGGNCGARADRNPGDLQRQDNWELTAGVQHQVAPRLAVGAMLFKRQIREIALQDRSFITHADYTAFQTTIPAADWNNIARDPDVAGVLDRNEVLTIYNLRAEKNSVYGRGLIDRSSNEDKSLYTGIEASFSARLAGGAVVFGSWTAEKNVSVFCESDDNPNGPTTGDLYQGRPIAQGGRFCAPIRSSVPARVQVGRQRHPAVRHRYRRCPPELWWIGARHHLAAGCKSLSWRTNPGSDDCSDGTRIALRRAMGSTRHQLQEKHPIRKQGSHLSGGCVQRVQQQLDPYDDRFGGWVAWPGDCHPAGPIPEGRLPV
jgi:hypothetical protein